jgi:hypothetical protein
MLPAGSVVMLPLAKVVMLPANALEAVAIVSNEARRIDWNRFIVFTPSESSIYWGGSGLTGVVQESCLCWVRPLTNNCFVLMVPTSKRVP